MANFNKTKITKPNATSYEGASAYNKNVVEDWTNFLFSCFLENRYYESADKQMERYIELTDKVSAELGDEFVAKASLFARNELGMRSISQMTAAYLNGKQFDHKRAYFRNFCHRPDDVAETLAAIKFLDGKRSHAMVRGFGDYLSGLNEYQLGKYKLNNKEYSMYDCINICHAHSAVIDKYKAGALETPETWETKISASTQETKAKEWHTLVEQGKLGYIALIRNLRNILQSAESAEWIQRVLVPQIENEVAIKKSLIYPYQIYCAYKNLMEWGVLNVTTALDKAFRVSAGNMPQLPGSSVILLDVSGSMESAISGHSNMTIKEVGAVYAAAIYAQSSDCDFIKFGTRARQESFFKYGHIFQMISHMQNNDRLGHGTNVEAAYDIMTRHYDRIFLISDMQMMTRGSWLYEGFSASTAYHYYCKEYGAAKLYSFDLGNYKTQTDNPNNPNVFLLTALNDKIFDFIELAEKGVNLVDYINENYTYV